MLSRTRLAIAAGVLLGGLTVPVGGVVPGAVAATPDCTAGGGTGDVNGDGYTDTVVADPAATVDGHTGAGIVQVRYGVENDNIFGASPGSSSATFSQGMAAVGGTAETNDAFGTVLAVGRVDADTCADVVVGAPGEDLDTAVDAGEVHVIFGSAAGLGQGRAGLVLHPGLSGIEGSPASGDRFGSALGVTDRYGLSSATPEPRAVYVGAPGVEVDGADAAGAAYVLRTSDAGDVTTATTITQSSAGVPGSSEAGDRFGATLDVGYLMRGCRGDVCQDMVVGVPGENDGAGAVVAVSTPDAGAPFDGSLSITQNTAGVPGISEAGDGFGSALDLELDGFTGYDYLGVGVPGEDVGTVADAGTAHLLSFSGEITEFSDQSYTQGSGGVVGRAESGDGFGSSVMVTEMWWGTFQLGMLVGTPGEDVGSVVDAGFVQYFGGRGAGVAGQLGITQSTPGVPGKVEAGEHLGAALGESGDGYLVVGVPDDQGYDGGVALALPWVALSGTTPDEPAIALTLSGSSRFGAGLAHEN